jgi:hypothetical protein
MENRTAEGFDENGWFIAHAWARNLDRHAKAISENCDQTQENSKVAADRLIRESVCRDSSPKGRRDKFSNELATIRWSVECFRPYRCAASRIGLLKTSTSELRPDTCATLIRVDDKKHPLARSRVARPQKSKPVAHPLTLPIAQRLRP